MPASGLSWAILGPSWACLGAVLGHLGPVLGCLGPVSGCFGLAQLHKTWPYCTMGSKLVQLELQCQGMPNFTKHKTWNNTEPWVASWCKLSSSRLPYFTATQTAGEVCTNAIFSKLNYIHAAWLFHWPTVCRLPRRSWQ